MVGYEVRLRVVGLRRWAPKTAGLIGTFVGRLGFWGVFLADTMAEDGEED